MQDSACFDRGKSRRTGLRHDRLQLAGINIKYRLGSFLSEGGKAPTLRSPDPNANGTQRQCTSLPCKPLHLHVRRASFPVMESTTTKVAGDFRTASRYAMAAAAPALPLSMQPQTVKPMKAASATTGTARSS